MSSDEKRSSQRPIVRPRVPQGPLADLKALLYELYLEAGTPRLDQIEEWLARTPRDASPGQATAARIIGGATMPPSYADLEIVVRVLARAALWNPDDAVRRARDLWVAARMAVPAGVSLAEITDPFSFEVHRPGEVEDASAVLPPLPSYVGRPHDDLLGHVVRAAADGDSGIAVLVGGSSTGKTRACWEALGPLRQAGGWRLLHPIDPSRPDALLRELAQVGPRTVVWLNEAQLYLAEGGKTGEQVAAGLRELLRDPGRRPVLVLATLWPEYWGELTRRPAASAPDPYAQARELLTSHAITVPAALTRAELEAAAAMGDPRLAQAAGAAEGGRVIQFLAGAPELIARYDNATPGARALLDAAIDARRLGMGTSLSRAFLEAAASGYIADADWDALADDWLDSALEDIGKPAKGIRGPLAPARPRPGAAGGQAYRLADYLEQHGRRKRRSARVPTSTWDAILGHALVPSEAARIAASAECRLLYRYATPLYRRAADGGEEIANWMSARVLADCGDLDELRARADVGNRYAAARLADLPGEGSDFRLHARPGPERSYVAFVIASLRYEAGDMEGLRALANGGSSYGAYRLAGLLAERGDLDEAAQVLRSLTDTGDWYAADRLAVLLAERGDLDEAIQTLRAQARVAGWTPDEQLADLLAERGDLEALRVRAETGNEYHAHRLAVLLAERGDLDGAIQTLRAQARVAGRPPDDRLAVLLAERGDLDGLRAKAGLGGRTAAYRLAVLLAQHGDLDELRARADASDEYAAEQLANLLAERGDLDELLSRADADGHAALRLSHLLAERGDLDGLLSRADVGHGSARDLAKVLNEQGRAEEAARLRRFGLNPDGSIAWE